MMRLNLMIKFVCERVKCQLELNTKYTVKIHISYIIQPMKNVDAFSCEKSSLNFLIRLIVMVSAIVECTHTYNIHMYLFFTK